MAAAATASAASWTGSASGSYAAQGVGGGAHVRALQAVAPPVASASRLDIRRQCPCVDLPHSHSHGRSRTVALAKFVKNLMLRHSHGRTVALRARSTQQPRVAAPQLAMGLRVAGRGWGPDRRSKSSPVAAV